MEPDSTIYGFQSGDPAFHTHPHLNGACSYHEGGHLPHSHPLDVVQSPVEAPASLTKEV